MKDGEFTLTARLRNMQHATALVDCVNCWAMRDNSRENL